MGNLCTLKQKNPDKYKEDVPVVSINTQKIRRPLSAAKPLNQDLFTHHTKAPLYMVKQNTLKKKKKKTVGFDQAD